MFIKLTTTNGHPTNINVNGIREFLVPKHGSATEIWFSNGDHTDVLEKLEEINAKIKALL